MDLFGADVSSNAATFYSTGLKGRFDETKIDDDHLLAGATYPVLEVRDGRLAAVAGAGAERAEREAARRLRQGCGRRHRALEQDHREERHPVPAQAPHKAFNRRIGPLSAVRVDPDGNVVAGGRLDAAPTAVAAVATPTARSSPR